jgi:DNA-binding transcriptional LysR family regulator
MNWQSIIFDWNQVRAFLATVEEGSFSGAARALKTTQPTIGRQVSGLEEALGVTLFERTVRGTSLTETGRELIDHVRSMGEAATLISMVAAGQSQEIEGDVSLTASDLMAAVILPPILSRLRDLFPGIRVQVIASNEIQNLTRREADIAIRHVRPSQPALIARHVGDFRANLYAACAYLDRIGRPDRARELAQYDFVGSPNLDRLISVLHDRDIPVGPSNFVVSSESGVVLWELVKSGFGIAMLPESLGETDAAVEKALPSLPSIEFPVWLVTHRELNTSRRIRVVFDHLARELMVLSRPSGSPAPR